MNKYFSLFFISLFILMSCEVDPKIQEELEKEEDIISNMSPGVVRVRVTEDFAKYIEEDPMTKTKSFSNLKVISMSRTFPYAGKFEDRTRAEGLHLWYDVIFNEEYHLTKAKLDLSIEGIEEVEFLPKIQIIGGDIQPMNSTKSEADDALIFDDPMLSSQWHYYNDGESSMIRGSDINVFPVWKQYTKGSPDVIVSIVDGGIDIEHEDLKDNIWHNLEEINGVPGVDDDNNGFVDDKYGYNFINYGHNIVADNHGTHVAGTIAATNNNGIGVSGIAGGDYKEGMEGVKLMSCQILDDTKRPGGTEKAIKYGADNGAVISQNSWGYNPPLEHTPSSVKAAIDYFIKYAGIDENGNQVGPMKGGIVIFASGNENVDYGAPASYEKCLAVSSIGADFNKAYYSSYGDWVDICAPGGDVKKGYQVLSTIAGNKYGRMQGTSMACPHISGVAALLVSYFKAPGFTPEMLKTKIINTAKDIYEYNSAHIGQLGSGLVDAHKAIASSSKIAPDAVKDFEISSTSNIVNLSWNVTADKDDIKAYGFSIYYSPMEFYEIDLQNMPNDIKVTTVESESFAVGEKLSYTINDLNFSTKYFIAIDAYDLSQNHSQLSPIKTILTKENNPPILNPSEEIIINMEPYETKVVKFKYLDPDGHSVKCKVESTSNAVSYNIPKEGELVINIDATKAEENENIINIIVKDEYGLYSQNSIKFSINRNIAPVVIKEIEDQLLGEINKSKEIDIKSYIMDANNEPLSYNITTSPAGIIHAVINEDILYLRPLKYGTSNVTITATDAKGESCSTAFRTLVYNSAVSVEVFPNPVIDKINIRTATEVFATYSIYNQAGSKVLEDGISTSPFKNGEIEFSNYPAGTYIMKLIINGLESSHNFIKL